MDYVLYAVPFFFLLIGLELLADRWRGMHTYRLADALNSLSAGVLSQATGLLTKVLGLLTYAFAWEHLALFDLSDSSLWVWLFAFVLYDFCYYWNHRLGHERNVLWAAHAVHHQSEDYNLSTALRQTSTGFIFGWIFYLPMAVAGVPPLVLLHGSGGHAAAGGRTRRANTFPHARAENHHRNRAKLWHPARRSELGGRRQRRSRAGPLYRLAGRWYQVRFFH